MRTARSWIITGSLVTIAGIAVIGYVTQTPTDQGRIVAKEGGPIRTQDARLGVRQASSTSLDVLSQDGQTLEIQPLRRETDLLRGDVDTLKKQLQGLKDTVARLSREVTRQATVVGTDVVLDEDFRSEPEHMEAYLAQADKAENEYLEAIEASLQNEPTNRVWSSTARDDIERALLAEQLADTEVIDIDCRATVCRVELEHSTTDAAIQFHNVFPERISRASLQIALVQAEQGDGWNSTVLYLTREGYSLPPN